MKFYEKLIKLRKQRGLSQEELANVLDISRQSVYKWEAGTNMPDKANLERLTTFFNVSFNYLLDDTTEEDETALAYVKSTVRKSQFRRVFISPHPYHSEKSVSFEYQADFEHGYLAKQRERVKNSQEIFNANKREVENSLRERGYSNVQQIQTNLLVYYFEDNKNRTFGFFFDGAEQFVCPFENLIDYETKNSGSEIIQSGGGFFGFNIGRLFLGTSGGGDTITAPYIHTLTILYFDEEGINQEYVLSFSKVAEYLFVDSKSVKDAGYEMEAISLNLGGILTRIGNRLKGLKAQAQIIKSGDIQVDELDMPSFIKRYEKAMEKNQNKFTAMQNAFNEKKKKQSTRKLITVGIILGILLLLVIIF